MNLCYLLLRQVWRTISGLSKHTGVKSGQLVWAKETVGELWWFPGLQRSDQWYQDGARVCVALILNVGNALGVFQCGGAYWEEAKISAQSRLIIPCDMHSIYFFA